MNGFPKFKRYDLVFYFGLNVCKTRLFEIDILHTDGFGRIGYFMIGGSPSLFSEDYLLLMKEA